MDEAAPLGIRYEVAGRDHPAERVRPTDQRLVRHEAGGLGVDDRLVMQGEAVAREGRPQLGIQPQGAEALVQHRGTTTALAGTLAPTPLRAVSNGGA